MLQAGRSKNAGGYRFGFQGQEADNKIGGLGQHLNYTFRNYDSWAIRFGAIDPLASKYPYWSPFAFSGNRVIDAVELEGLEPYRIIFWGGTREKEPDGSDRKKGGKRDNNTFYQAALQLRKYKDIENKMSQITTADQIIYELEILEDGSVEYLDILSHGTPYSLNFSETKNVNVGFYASWLAKKATERGYIKQDPVENAGYHFSRWCGAREVDEIPYNKFSENAIIELHGCKGGCSFAEAYPESKEYAQYADALLDNIAMNMSEGLYGAGKTYAVAIAHHTRSSPEGGSYQHGGRSVYWNGQLLFETTKKGDISKKEIKKEIDKITNQ